MCACVWTAYVLMMSMEEDHQVQLVFKHWIQSLASVYVFSWKLYEILKYNHIIHIKKDLKRGEWNRLAKMQWNWIIDACAQLSELSRCSWCWCAGIARWNPSPNNKKDTDELINDALGTCNNHQVNAKNKKKNAKNNLIVLYKTFSVYSAGASYSRTSYISEQT